MNGGKSCHHPSNYSPPVIVGLAASPLQRKGARRGKSIGVWKWWPFIPNRSHVQIPDLPLPTGTPLSPRLTYRDQPWVSHGLGFDS
jgi:hypothetical protein